MEPCIIPAEAVSLPPDPSGEQMAFEIGTRYMDGGAIVAIEGLAHPETPWRIETVRIIARTGKKERPVLFLPYAACEMLRCA